MFESVLTPQGVTPPTDLPKDSLNWPMMPVEALCERVTSGSTPLRSRRDYYEGGEIPWYKTGELNDWYLEPSAEKITATAFKETSVKLFPPETILMAMYGDGKTITTLGILRNHATSNQACAALIADRTKCEPRYLFYALKARRHILINLASGGAQRNLSAKLIKSFELPVPPLDVQRRIAGILSAYDDLIENCRRRIEILEEMARSLYREWFVHFRYPGHESVPLVPSPLGLIPHGWQVTELKELVRFQSGFAFKSSTFVADGEYSLVTIKNVQDGRFIPACETRISALPLNLPEHCILNDGDLILSLTGNVGRVCLVFDGPYLLNQRVAKLKTNAANEWPFTYCALRDPEMKLKLEQISNGVAQQNLSPVQAANMQIILPPGDLRAKFSSLGLIAPLAYQMKKIEILRDTRDVLLSKLLDANLRR